jgi:hypothetical protein
MTRLTSLTLALVAAATLIIALPASHARPAAAHLAVTDDSINASTIIPIGEEVEIEQPVLVTYTYTVTAGGVSTARTMTVLFGPYPASGGPAIGTVNMIGVGELDMRQGYAYVIDEPVPVEGGDANKVTGGTRPTIKTPRVVATSDSTRYIVHITTDVDRVYIVEGNTKVTKRRTNQVVSPCPNENKYIEVTDAGAHEVRDTPADSAFIQHVREIAAKFEIEAP